MPDTVNPVATAAPSVRDALRRAASPLSDCQQRVWRLATGDPATIWAERIALRFSGPLRVGALCGAVDELVRRHAILRTVFVVLDGEPMQCVRSTARGVLVVDLEALAPAVRKRAETRLVRRDRRTAIDVRRGPLLRTVLIRVAPGDHVLLLTAHHLVFDGWSQTVMFRELSLLFLSFSLNLPSPLPALRAQYADLARREHHAARSAARDARLQAVAGRLRGLGPAATLPLDHRRPAHTSHRAGALPFVVPEPASRALRALAERAGVTPFMLGLAATALALQAMTPELDEMTFGTAVANRASVDAQALIGPFVNIVVIRLMTPGDMTVRELLRSTRAALLDAFADQDVPFDRVIETLHPGTPKDSYGPTGGEPLFRVCVDFTEDAADGPTQTTPNLTITPLDTDDVKSGCDLYLNFSASRETLRANVLYSAELFERGTAVAFVDRLQAILGSLDRQLDRRLAEVHS